MLSLSLRDQTNLWCSFQFRKAWNWPIKESQERLFMFWKYLWTGSWRRASKRGWGNSNERNLKYANFKSDELTFNSSIFSNANDDSPDDSNAKLKPSLEFRNIYLPILWLILIYFFNSFNFFDPNSYDMFSIILCFL